MFQLGAMLLLVVAFVGGEMKNEEDMSLLTAPSDDITLGNQVLSNDIASVVKKSQAEEKVENGDLDHVSKENEDAKDINKGESASAVTKLQAEGKVENNNEVHESEGNKGPKDIITEAETKKEGEIVVPSATTNVKENLSPETPIPVPTQDTGNNIGAETKKEGEIVVPSDTTNDIEKLGSEIPIPAVGAVTTQDTGNNIETEEKNGNEMNSENGMSPENYTSAESEKSADSEKNSEGEESLTRDTDTVNSSEDSDSATVERLQYDKTVRPVDDTKENEDQDSASNSASEDANKDEAVAVKRKEEKETTEEEEQVVESSEESKMLKKTISENDDTGMKEETMNISMKCLDCLCYFATGCDIKRECVRPSHIFPSDDGFSRGDCGPFHISFPFWADAFNKKMDLGDAEMENEWKTCSLDLMCATQAMKKYFKKYPHDCNGDGKVDCLDYSAIHTLGPFGCLNRSNLQFWNMNRRKGLLKCMVREEEGQYTQAMRKLQMQDFAAKKREELEKIILEEIQTGDEKSDSKEKTTGIKEETTGNNEETTGNNEEKTDNNEEKTDNSAEEIVIDVIQMR